MRKLLYINDYNCTSQRIEGYPSNHLWGADELSLHYEVVCAKVPADIVRGKSIFNGYINFAYKNLVLALKYFRFPLVYSACGNLAFGFALFNILHLGNRRLFQIQHHCKYKIPFSTGYTKIFFISPHIKNLFPNLKNAVNLNWGGGFSVC